MRNTRNAMPMLPGFHLQTLRRKPRPAQQKLAGKIALLKQKSFKQIGEVFERFIPRTLLKPEQDGAMSRQRSFDDFIAYNCVRRMMYEAAEEADLEVRVVSFKGSVQALRSWEPHLNQAKISRAERFRLISDLYDAMTNTPIRQRPGRSEPRCLKRRPKNYQRLTSPRHEMRAIPHRNRYHAAIA